jgi:site-specific recombinase XerD
VTVLPPVVVTRAGPQHWSSRNFLHLPRRHSAGSLLFAMGLPMKVISETLGHSSERVTSEVYVHIQAHHRVEAAEAIARALWG